MSRSPLLQFDLASPKTRALVRLLFTYEALCAAIDAEPVLTGPTPIAWLSWIQDVFHPAKAEWHQAVHTYQSLTDNDETVVELLQQIADIRAVHASAMTAGRLPKTGGDHR